MAMNLSRQTSVGYRRWSRLGAGIVGMVWLSCLVAGSTAAVAADDDFFTHLHTDKAMANVTVSPGRAGPVDISIQLETVDERPLAAKAVSVTLSSPKAGSGRQTVEATRITDDRWQAKTQLPQSGRWMLGLGISVSDGDKISIEAPILIGAPGKGPVKKSGKDGAAHQHRH
jgi:copper transport protein